MSIAITDEHRSLTETVADFLTKKDARAANRAQLETPEEQLPSFWSEFAANGWLGLHVPGLHDAISGRAPDLEEGAVRLAPYAAAWLYDSEQP